MFYRPSSLRELRQPSHLQRWNGWAAFQKKSWSAKPGGAVLEQLSTFCRMVLIFWQKKSENLWGSWAIGIDDAICVHFVLFMSLFVTENSSLHVVDTVIFELKNVVFALLTNRVILCFNSLKICLWTVSPERSHCLSARRFSCFKARSCEATALYHGDNRRWGTLRCVSGACRSKRARSWSFNWPAVDWSRVVTKVDTSALKASLSMARMFLVVWNTDCCLGREISR